MDKTPICVRCVLPESSPDIRINSEGVCNICEEAERSRPGARPPLTVESGLLKILDRHRGKHRYDCLVMCSGGKDSTLSLYYMKKRYRMNVLAFTFDHGFENEQAVANVRSAVSTLGVDWLYFRSDFMKGVFRKAIESGTKAPLCHICAIWYIRQTFDIAARQGIPLVVAGWTKGQSTEGRESGREYGAMSAASSDFISRVLRADPATRDFPLSIRDALKERAGSRITAVSPHWFQPYDPVRCAEILQKELSWKAPELSYPAGSTNCMMNFVSVYLSMKNFGYTHYHIELSKLIRKGELSREEALKLLEISFKRDLVEGIAARAGCRLP